METNRTTTIKEGRQESNQRPQIPLLAGNRTNNLQTIGWPTLSPEPWPTFGYFDHYCSCYSGNQASKLPITNLTAASTLDDISKLRSTKFQLPTFLPLLLPVTFHLLILLVLGETENRTGILLITGWPALPPEPHKRMADKCFVSWITKMSVILISFRGLSYTVTIIIWKHAATLMVYATWTFFK